MKTNLTFYLLLLLSTAAPVAAQQARPMAEDPVLEERLMNLSRELRCLVCQNETLADSRADLAVDLRNEIREQMKAGKTDQEIITFLTARYGDFVLYRPPVKASTYFLWFGPFVLLLGGLFLLFRYVKQRRQIITEKPLSADQRRDVEALLQMSDKEKTA